MRSKKLFAAALLLLAALCLPGALCAADVIGVVLLHGKNGEASANGEVARVLGQAGFLVERPEMPWSKRRQFDASYDQAMLEIDAAVAGLRARGATKVAIAGHSLGANAAMGYAARRTGLYAVIALAPGHVPEGYLRRFGEDIRHARELVAAGKGDSTGSFSHDNQGSVLQMTTTVAIYLSYCDPEVGAVIPRNVAAFKESLPFLWVVGASDVMFKRGEEYAFAKAPANPKSRYLVVQAGHKSTPDMAAGQVALWLQGLKD